MFYKSKVEIECLGDYIKEIERLSEMNGNFFQWYRGHGNLGWELVPKVQRGFNGNNNEELFRKSS